MHFHPMAEKFPRLTGEEFDEFVADIKKNGQRQKIMLGPDGRIIDGINRFNACAKLKIQPKYESLPKGTTEEQVLDYIVSVNIRRRHLSSAERLDLALEMSVQLEAAAKERQRAAGGSNKKEKSSGESGRPTPRKSEGRPDGPVVKGKARDVAAKKFRISNKSFDRGKRLQKEDPELYKQVKEEKISLSRAYEILDKGKDKKTELTKNKAWITKSTRYIHDLGTLRNELPSCSADDEFLGHLRMMVEHFKVVGGEFERWLIKHGPRLKVVKGGKK